MQRIRRIKSQKDFTIIPNIVFNSGLSIKAIGLLSFILHLPNDWVLYKTWLYSNMPKDGRDTIKTAWDELKAKGFITEEKTAGTGKGKLPETNYIVYDSPIKTCENPQDSNFSIADLPQRKNRQRKKGTLLSTNTTSTKKQSTNISLLPNGNNEPQSQKPDKPLKAKAKPEGSQDTPRPKKEPEPPKTTEYPDFIAVYDKWFKDLHDGVPPDYTSGNGTAAKGLITYMRNICNQKAKNNNEYLDDANVQKRALESWQYILNNWHKLDNFLQGKTRLIDIKSNIQNIITQIKNGNHQSKSTKQPTGGDVSMRDIATKIDRMYSGHNG